MRNYLVGMIAFAMAFLVSLTAFAACPCSGCGPTDCECMGFEKTAGIIDMDKAAKRNNWETIKWDQDFSEFEKLVKKAGLKHKLIDERLTVFLPTNAAIDSMDQAYLDCLKKKENKDKLVRFVLAHLAPCDKSSFCICKKQKVKMQNGCCLKVDRCCNKLKVARSCILLNDVNTESGKIHVINRVLYPYS